MFKSKSNDLRIGAVVSRTRLVTIVADPGNISATLLLLASTIVARGKLMYVVSWLIARSVYSLIVLRSSRVNSISKLVLYLLLTMEPPVSW